MYKAVLLLVLLCVPVAAAPPQAPPLPQAPSWIPPQAPPLIVEPEPVKEPAHEFKTYNYKDGVELSKTSGKPLLVWVEKDLKSLPAVPPSGYIMATTESLSGFPSKCLVLSTWINGRHLGIVLDVSVYDKPEVLKAALDRLRRGVVGAAPNFDPNCTGRT